MHQGSGDQSRDAHLPLQSINHISRVTADLEEAVAFYRDVLGFILVRRPQSLGCNGAWLWRYGLGLHLLQGTPPQRPAKIDPQADHVSFQAESVEAVEAALRALAIPYVLQTVEEGGVQVKQLFFHDPDRNMLEVWCEFDLQLSRCHTCALEAKRLLHQHGQPTADAQAIPEGDESADLEAACSAACSAACAHSPADDGACCPHQRGSSQENDAANDGGGGGGHACKGPECATEQACKALSAVHLGEKPAAAVAAAAQHQ